MPLKIDLQIAVPAQQYSDEGYVSVMGGCGSECLWVQ